MRCDGEEKRRDRQVLRFEERGREKVSLEWRLRDDLEFELRIRVFVSIHNLQIINSSNPILGRVNY
jgi:hypothetical protein